MTGGGAPFDLADVDLDAVSRAGKRAKELAGQVDQLWWVSVKVPDGESAPRIKAEAVGSRRTVTIELEADGTPISERFS